MRCNVDYVTLRSIYFTFRDFASRETLQETSLNRDCLKKKCTWNFIFHFLASYFNCALIVC